MTRSFFLSEQRTPAARRALEVTGGERVLWQGRCALAEFPDPSAVDVSAPAWELPPTTEVLVTDRRLAFAHRVQPVSVGAPRVWPPYRALRPVPAADPAAPGEAVLGELRWQWPEHLAVDPGADMPGATARIGLVCGARDARPMLLLGAGDLTDVTAADRLANLLRRAVVQFRLDHAAMLGLPVPRERMLARLLIDAEFDNRPGGPGATLHVPGAIRMSGTGANAPLVTTSARAS
jgi:hypothetical protein